jgi:hypothetical protein
MAKERPEGRRPFQKWIPEEALEHARAARQEYWKSFESLFPPQFISRRRAARKKMLLAVRSVIDAALERSEPPQDAD